MIRNTAINQDGKTNGITLSSQQAQESLLRYVYQCTGLNPRFYTLCRGTWDWLSCWRYHCAAGNSQRLLWNGRRPDSLHFGSVKSNIEHLESSSGLARLFKTVLILEKGLIPSNADSQIRKEEIKIGSMI